MSVVLIDQAVGFLIRLNGPFHLSVAPKIVRGRRNHDAQRHMVRRIGSRGSRCETVRTRSEAPRAAILDPPDDPGHHIYLMDK